MFDARKSLTVLQNEWEGCQKCRLGEHRDSIQGQMCFGEGQPLGIMFIGEGPGGTEERGGRPFIGQSGALLRMALERLGLTHYWLSNVVLCRSCMPRMTQGGELYLQHGMPMWLDESPKLAEINACLPRLQEEIYLVDPTIIVSLGDTATTVLRGRHDSISKLRGKACEITIPGALHSPVFTEKKRIWMRKHKVNPKRPEFIIEAPVRRSEVRYTLIPTWHPAYVLRTSQDRSSGNPTQEFVADLTLAINAYRETWMAVYGYSPITEPKAISIDESELEAVWSGDT